MVDLHFDQVGPWRKRYEEYGGWLAGLDDLHRSGRPCVCPGTSALGGRVGLDLGDLHGRGRGVGVGDRVPAARGGPRHLQLEHDFVGLTGDGDAARCADLPDSVAVEVGGDGLARNELVAVDVVPSTDVAPAGPHALALSLVGEVVAVSLRVR